MIVRGRDFNDIYDLVGVRILVDTVRDCYAALGVIHANWQPVPGRFKDYIAMPKFNMYQSLHTTVIGPHGKPVEMQIRTYAMHRTAEYGIAAHWKYKEKARAAASPAPGVGAPAGAHRRDDLAAPAAGLAAGGPTRRVPRRAALRPRPQEVYVFTPKGDVIPLPRESTPVDFAYAVHTEVGRTHRRPGQRQAGAAGEHAVQRRRDRDLHVEVGDGRPDAGLAAVRQLPRARTKIRQYFNKERREEAIEAGKDAIIKAMRKAGLPLQRMLDRRRADDARPGPAPRRRHLALRGGRREPGLGAVGGGEADHRPSAATRARSRTSPRPRSPPGRRPRRRPAATRASSSTA